MIAGTTWPRKAAHVPRRSSHPSTAAKLTTAGAENVRNPATIPINRAKMYGVIGVLLSPSGRDVVPAGPPANAVCGPATTPAHHHANVAHSLPSVVTARVTVAPV